MKAFLASFACYEKLIYDTTDLFLRDPVKTVMGAAQRSFFYGMKQ